MTFSKIINDAHTRADSLDIDVNEHGVSPYTMMQIARAASANANRPTVTFRNCEAVLPQTRYDVALAARGCVVFAE